MNVQSLSCPFLPILTALGAIPDTVLDVYPEPEHPDTPYKRKLIHFANILENWCKPPFSKKHFFNAIYSMYISR